MGNYAAAVNVIRILCPDGTYREPCPSEIASLDKKGNVAHARRITAETVEIIITY